MIIVPSNTDTLTIGENNIKKPRNNDVVTTKMSIHFRM